MKPDAYWERRYRRGGDSGDASRGRQAKAKAKWINTLILRENITSVLDIGCGDGSQLALLDLDDVDYLGTDVSATAIRQCLQQWPKRQFARVDPGQSYIVQADLAMSIDVMFHLPDNNNYIRHLEHLFTPTRWFVAIRSTDYEDAQHGHHLRRRRFTPDVAAYYPEWEPVEQPDDPHTEGFHLYRRRS